VIIGILKEIQAGEYRVAVVPQGVRHLAAKGHQVMVETGSGVQAGFPDADYLEAGAQILPGPDAVTRNAELIVKVKTPEPSEYNLFRDEQALFAYLVPESHPGLVDMLIKRRMTAIAFEKVRDDNGGFPLLWPMSLIAGQQAVLQGMQFLCTHQGGPGISLVAFPGLEPPRVVIFGAGQAGMSAAKTAAALGADVFVFEKNPGQAVKAAARLPANARVFHIESVSPEPYVLQADMVINTATVPPDAPKHLLDRKTVKKMKKGAVIVDVTARLRGAIETVDRHTTHKNPVWDVDGVTHYAVPNIPGIVPHTASIALGMAVLPWLAELADRGIAEALAGNIALRRGIVAFGGRNGL